MTNEQIIIMLALYIACLQDVIDRFCDHQSTYAELRQYRGR